MKTEREGSLERKLRERDIEMESGGGRKKERERDMESERGKKTQREII